MENPFVQRCKLEKKEAEQKLELLVQPNKEINLHELMQYVINANFQEDLGRELKVSTVWIRNLKKGRSAKVEFYSCLSFIEKVLRDKGIILTKS